MWNNPTPGSGPISTILVQILGKKSLQQKVDKHITTRRGRHHIDPVPGLVTEPVAMVIAADDIVIVTFPIPSVGHTHATRPLSGRFDPDIFWGFGRQSPL